ncbi:ImpA family metalloprotease [Acinetobacter sp. ANC 4648]|uniref:ImpA family metalloprotease n=1 Tax=Acinetobacter sp. ANC 4648 TaxID=1977875 RepID=UPI001D1711A5|nr:ImpA family metalloprotease [Acinetobacter sp. ANC 4648]
MASQALAFRNALLTISLSVGLIACGGGGESHTQENPPITTKPDETVLNERINQALKTGSASNLTEQDRQALLQWALSTAKQQQFWQKSLLTALYTGAKQQDLKPHLQFTPNSSINIYPADLSTALPIAVSDSICNWPLSLQANKGCGLGVAAQVGQGRALAYGQNMFTGVLNNNADVIQFSEVLNNSLRWLITGNTQTPLNASLNIAVSGYDTSTAKRYFEQQLGTTVTLLDCNVLDSSNSCWKNADLILIGSNIDTQKFDRELIQNYLDAGKPVYFQASGYNVSSNMEKVLAAMGMQSNGNYWRTKESLLLSDSKTHQQRWNNINQIDATINTLQYFKDPASVSLGEINVNNSIIQNIKALSSSLQTLNNQGVSAFSEDNKNSILKALVLIADLWRPNISYTALSKSSDPLTFMKTYASDAWLDYNRSYTTAALQGAGDYMPAEAQNMPVSDGWETITVTIPQESGVTAIGRASIPAKALNIKIKDAQGANLSIQTSYLRTWGNPFDDSGYKRPLRPNSYSVKLNNQIENPFISPFGGPLMLNYSNAKPGSTITLEVKGGAKYAHYDFTQAISESEMIEASAILQSKTFGWNTFKFVGGEIQQINAYALKAIGNSSPRDYIEKIKTVIYDSNHIANGYNNMPLDGSTQQYCNTLGWDCTSAVHRAPSVQHFIGWIATCGFLCSGNPSDGSTGLDIGWGWVHELGHNTVQAVLSMTFKSTENGNTIGCGTECDNNILAGLSMLRKYEIYKLDNNGNNFNHPQLYTNIKDNRNTNLSGEALRAEMEKRVWQGSDNAKQAVYLQLAHNYTKLHQAKSQPDLQGVFEFMRLLNISQRLYNQIDLAKATEAEKNKLGLAAFAKKDLSRPDLLYVLSSKIMGYDLKKMFQLYGLPVTDTAHTSVAMLNLPEAPLYFYAQPANRSNHLNEGTWVTLPIAGSVPNYPY